MPLYELFCLAKPALTKPQLASMMTNIGKMVFSSGGVVTDVRSFGAQGLAYEIRRPGERYNEANVWQLTFAAPAGVLPEVDHALRVDETVLRWVVQKRKYLERLPNTYRISKMSKLAASNDAQENSSA
ncbi:hypothetical protein QBZ16_001153 [Prototheca wickerhamii]|uniref:Uncharacterized protein n=1 Tax=Prototheca wickerhamii TaxID=3111 RepID=A0AAD9IDP7_PROWI|nr:hypothetical protein QBZ16_001153 [Prototheca wickerhamii]